MPEPKKYLKPRVDVKPEAVSCSHGCGSDVTIQRLYVNGRANPLPRVTCQACLDRVNDERSAPPAEAPQGDEVLDWLYALGVNTRKHGHATLENFDATHAAKAIDAARDFTHDTICAGKHDRVQGLYLVHDTKGTGKSHIAVASMRAVHEARPDARVVYMPTDRFITKVQDSYGTGETDKLVEMMRAAHLLVLDDLGREKATDDALRTLCTVLDEREGAPTVITANDLPAKLATRYRAESSDLWDRVADRLGDQVYRYVLVPGVSRRWRGPEAA